MKEWIRKNRIITLIVIVAVAARLVGLSSNPPSLNWDEVSHGYNAYSILKTGKDEWGKFLPIIFRAYGDYKLPIYIYITSFSELFFGVSAFAVRLPSALAGVGSVVFTYLLVKKLFSEKAAFYSALFMAIEPWSLFLSRGAFEANLGQFFIIAGAYFLVDATKKIKNLSLAVLLLGLSAWTYNSARVFSPLFLASWVFLYRKTLLKDVGKNFKKYLIPLGIFLVIFVPMFYQLMAPTGSARYGWVAIIDEGAIGQIINLRGNSQLGENIARILYNRPTYFAYTFIKNYLSHFSLSYLFIEGGSHYQFSVPGYGLLYLVNLPFLLIGTALLVGKIKERKIRSLFLWLFLAPVASSLTREAPHVLRSITFLPIPMISSALGLVGSFEWIRNKTRTKEVYLYGVYGSILILFSLAYIRNYFNDYKKEYSWSWQYGYEQVVDYIKGNYGSYDKIIFSKKYGEPHEFLLFYWPWEPSLYQKDKELIRFNQSNWYWIDRFDKFYFVNDWEIPGEEWEYFVLESGEEFDCKIDDCLLVTSAGNYPKGWVKLEEINFMDDSIAFEILERSPK